MPTSVPALEYDPSCYLCPGNERAGGARNPRYEATFVFTNDFAALKPERQADSEHGLLLSESEAGICKVVCFSPRHDLTLARMTLPGGQIFSVTLDESTFSSTLDPWGVTQSSTATSPPVILNGPIIAGDGYAYVVYENQIGNSVSNYNHGTPTFGSSDTIAHLTVLRVGTEGSSSKIHLRDWESKFAWQYTYCFVGSIANRGGFSSSGQNNCNSFAYAFGAPLPQLSIHMITNADQGTAIGWEADTREYCASGSDYNDPACPGSSGDVPAASTYGFGTTVGTILAYSGSTSTAVFPVLQAQDGSFFGTDNTGGMIRFNQHGDVIWSMPNDSPQIATADGGVIGYSGVTYDSQGRATGQVAIPIQSWTGNFYEVGSVHQKADRRTRGLARIGAVLAGF